MVEEYVRNTHAKTHSQYKLKVTHVFRASCYVFLIGRPGFGRLG